MTSCLWTAADANTCSNEAAGTGKRRRRRQGQVEAVVLSLSSNEGEHVSALVRLMHRRVRLDEEIRGEDLRRRADEASRGHAVLSHSYRVLRAILTTAVEDELLPRNPCTVKGAGTDRPKERRLPTAPEVWALSDAVPGRYRALVWAAATALCSAELSGLRRCDADLLHRRLHVRQTYVEPACSAAYSGRPSQRPATASSRSRRSWSRCWRRTSPSTRAPARRGSCSSASASSP